MLDIRDAIAAMGPIAVGANATRCTFTIVMAALAGRTAGTRVGVSTATSFTSVVTGMPIPIQDSAYVEVEISDGATSQFGRVRHPLIAKRPIVVALLIVSAALVGLEQQTLP